MSSRTNEVKPEWPIKTVEELVNENTLDKPLDGNHGGIHPKSTDYVQEGIPFIMANDLVNNKINFENCKYITEEQAIGLKKGKAIEGDVLLTHKATMGRTAIVVNAPSDYIVLTPQVTYYRILNKGVLNNSFLKYYFDSKDFQTLLNAWAQGGSTRSYLGITAQLKLPIRIPPLHEQKAIAHILSTLDEKIEVNNKINKTLENMAQAIFKQWFVDFEFPNEDGEPYKSSGGEMVESELGMIPKGWEVGTIGDYVKVKSGYAFKSAWWDSDGIRVVKIKDISNGTLDLTDCSFVSETNVSDAQEFVINGGEILIAMTGATIGKFAIVPKMKQYALVNQRVGKFFLGDKPFDRVSFLYCILNQSNINEEIVSRGDGSAQPNISPSGIETIKIVIPHNCILDQFNNVMKFNFQKITENIYENSKLVDIRDSLLPKLMSGKIRVPLDSEGDAS